MKLGLRYQTTYRYEEAVGFSPHDVRLFPRSDRFSRVRRLDFTATPKATIRYSRDVFENIVASCFFPEKSKEIEFRLSINLDLDEKDPFHFILERGAVETPFEYDAEIAKILAPYRERRVKERLVVPGWEPPANRSGAARANVAELKRGCRMHRLRTRRKGALSPTKRFVSAAAPARRGGVAGGGLRQMDRRAADERLLRESDPNQTREGSLHAWTDVFLPRG